MWWNEDDMHGACLTFLALFAVVSIGLWELAKWILSHLHFAWK